jgi:septal ring factor EnvC (AmiA/AmiB activator)
MENITKKDLEEANKPLVIRLDKVEIDIKDLKTDVKGLKTEVSRHAVTQDEMRDDIQKMLESLNTSLQENKEFRENFHQVPVNTQNIDINKTAIKRHISDTTIHSS